MTSWRWSKLLDPPSYKRLVTHPEWIVPFITTIVLLLFCQDKTLDLPQAIIWLGWLSLALLIAVVLQNICCADYYYKIWSGKKIIRKIYIYTSGFFNKHPTARVIITNGVYEISEQIRLHSFSFFKWDDFSSFIFETNDDLSYYSSPVNEAELLGRPLSATAFYQAEHPNRLTVLDGYGTTVLEADTFFVKGVYIPPLARQNIKDEDTGETIILSDEHTQDFLITKRRKSYSVYGLSYDTRPACQRLIIPVVIFKEGSQEIILKWVDNYGYKEFYRSRNSVKRNVSDIFVELTYQNGIGGTVRKFNEQTGCLDLLYKGYFHGIDFDTGAIIGDHSYEYIPETK